MLDGELEVGCTPVFFIYLFVFVIFISESPMNRYVQTNCAPRIFFAPSAPNGEAHSLAYFRRTSLEGPLRSTQKLSTCPRVQYYCVTGSANEGVRVWVLIVEAYIGTYSVTSLSRLRLTLRF